MVNRVTMLVMLTAHETRELTRIIFQIRFNDLTAAKPFVCISVH